METPTRRRKIAILAVLVVVTIAGLGLRIGYAVEQPAAQPPDAGAYARIAENLYRDGSFNARPPGVSNEVQPASSYAPGLPLFIAGLYELSSGIHLTFALVVLALFGAGAIPLTYLLGLRVAGPVAGLIGATVIAIYPALLDYQGLLLTEPLAAFLLSAALIAFLYAADRPSPWRWLGGGALLGVLSLVRPEYLAIAVLLPLAWLIREGLRGQTRRSAALAGVSLLGTALVLAPWTIRNAIVLDRAAVPVSTGGGKALFIGTYLEADGDGPKLRELLLSERPALRKQLSRGGPVDDPNRFVLERVLSRVAAERYPGLETDAALGRMGRKNLEDDITQEPIAFTGILVDKAYESWTDSARAVMEREPWRALQLGMILLSLLGLAVLALRRRFEAVILGLVLAYMTAVGALLIASPRRELVVLPVLAALAGAGTNYAYEWLRSRVRH
jgi:4-amino-4-deoxy-L-arabinose transferase-like glycosyltransferase